MTCDIAEFPRNLRGIRCKQGLTQAELATRIGANPCTISKYESGGGLPTLAIAWSLATALGVTLDDLVSVTRVPA